LFSAAGWEVVGVGYSVPSVVHRYVEGNQQAARRGSQSAGCAQEEDCTRAEARKEGSAAKVMDIMMAPGSNTSKMPSLTGAVLRRVPAPRWCPPGLSKTQRRTFQKLRKK
jgi:hypothetical protein